MPHVLVVEDDPVTVDLMQIVLLGVPGLAVASVASAEDALAILEREDPVDALITDLHLPGRDGLALVRRLQEMPHRRGVPVIMVSSSGEPHDRLEAEAMGVRSFIRKPWSPAALRDAVNSVVNGA